MSDLFDVEIILSRNNYSKIYSAFFILLLIVIIFIYVVFTYNYQTYYIGTARVVDRTLVVKIKSSDIKYFKNNEIIELDNKKYYYYIDYSEGKTNKEYIDLKIFGLNDLMRNHTYQIKLPKENQKIAKYLIKYFKRR